MQIGEPVDFDREFVAAIAAERRASRFAARAFATAVECGDVDDFLYAVDGLNTTIDSWRLAMTYVGRLPSAPAEIQAAFLPVWIEHKMLPLAVANRRVLANALRRLLPLTQVDTPMRLYRGAGGRERRCRLYGFSWSSRIEVARQFAEHWAPSGEGAVILETVAPPEAVLLVREEAGYYDEGEVVVDPFGLGPVTVAERLRSSRG